MQRKIRRLPLMLAGAATVAAIFAATALAAGITVTTLPVLKSGIAPTSLALRGTVNTAAAPCTVFWQFQYSTNKSFSGNRGTGVVGIPVGTKAPVSVTATIRHLTPFTRYYYRVVALPGAGGKCNSPTYAGAYYGQALTANTSDTGLLLLRARHLGVIGRFVFVPLKCQSKIHCQGKFSITTHTTIKKGKTRHVATVHCATGSFNIKAGHNALIRARVSTACLVLMRHARLHRINAKITSGPRTNQKALIENITLRLR